MELLAPAGNLEKAKYAILYGADAVYMGGKDFSLRAKADNLNDEELLKAVEYIHSLGRKVFITVNIYPHNKHLARLEEYIKFLSKVNPDAVILSDPAVFSMVKQFASQIPIHISTQANVTNWQTAKFWSDLGAKRIILARELTKQEISEIKKNLPDVELEMFVHGAMCISYSGRCLLSAFLNNRHANLGECTHPCRWNYSLVEESRPGQYFPINQDEHGSYILNSKDLCLWDQLEEIHQLGIDSIKIEGRMKSVYYVANIIRTYKKAIDTIKNGKTPDPTWKDELYKVSHRIYSEGFFNGFDAMLTQHYESSAYSREWQYLGNIIDFDKQYITVSVLSKFSLGDNLEIIFPDLSQDIKLQITHLLNEKLEPIDFTKPNTNIKIPYQGELSSGGILRIKK